MTTAPATNPSMLMETARALCRECRFAEGIELFRQVVAAEPQNAAAHNFLGMALDRTGKSIEALPCFDRAIAIDPAFADALANKADALSAMGRYQEAVGFYDRALAAGPENALTWCNRALALHANGQHENALQDLDRALAIEPSLAEAHLNRIEILAKLGREGECITALGMLARVPTVPGSVLAALGNSLLRTGLSGAAQQAFQLVLSQEPQSLAGLAGKAQALHAAGHYEDAINAFDAAISVRGDIADLHAARAFSLKQAGRAAEALDSIDRALVISSNSAILHANRSSILQQLDRFEEAAVSAEKAVAIDKTSAVAYHNLASAYYALARWEKALAASQKALSLDPKIPEIHATSAKILRETNQLDHALASIERALQLQPRHADYLAERALCLGALGQYREALETAQTALSVNPDCHSAFLARGEIFTDQGHHDEAAAAFEKAVALNPADPNACIAFGSALLETGRLDEAMQQFRKTIALHPQRAEAYCLLAEALDRCGRHPEAFASLDTLLAASPDNLQGLNKKASLLGILGRFDETRAVLDRIFRIDPEDLAGHIVYGSYFRIRKDDPAYAAMQKIEKAIGTLRRDKRTGAHFMLGKAHAEAGNHARSFEHFMEGNRLKRAATRYDEKTIAKKFDEIRSIFSANYLREKAGHGHPSATPIFIIGMPRSGTSLIEQIIASHPEAHGAGELKDLGNIADETAAASHPNFSHFLHAATPHELETIGRLYAERVSALSPSSSRIVDKMPENFFLTGLIHLVLPNARIIHTRRDPIDTCMSCFSTLFQEGQNFSYDLEDLGRYYRRYERLMQHWHDVLPAGVMLDVQYEDVVEDTEAQARRIVQHCGLEWNDACLSFHRTDRPVRTASAAQVRQPIYRSAIGRWLPYKDHIRPLLEALKIPDA